MLTLNKNKSVTVPESARPVATNHTLQHLAGDLHEVCGVLSELCTQLEGGGIIQVRDIEPKVAHAVPKLRRVVVALNAIAMLNEGGRAYTNLAEVTTPSQSPLLM
jgi:hypothetical protein